MLVSWLLFCCCRRAMKDGNAENPQASTSPLKLDGRPPPPRALTAPMVEMPAVERKPEWNTKNLGLRLTADLASAASAAVLVAPILPIIDR